MLSLIIINITIMDTIHPLLQQQKNTFLEELIALLKLPSISADPAYKQAVLDTADKVAFFLKEAGATTVEICPTAGYPIVYAEQIIDATLPTILVYGHYDVQPPDPLELWDSAPFEPVIKDGKIYARGACDDKGQMFMHIKALQLMNMTNQLPCNVKFIIEGEEEVGSNNLDTFLVDNVEKLKADVVLVSDTSMIANDIPSITVGLRGLCYLEIEVTGPNRDLHSGVYGGAVPNPINVLANMIASLHDENKHITIPYFYDDVVEVSTQERQEMNAAPFSLENYKKDLAIHDVMGEKGYTSLERATIRPTLDVNGIWGGYTGEGAKTVLPSKAFAKISMRLVPNQSWEKITELFIQHFQSIAPAGVQVVVKAHHGGKPVVTPTNSIEYLAASQAMEKTFGKKPIPARGGGSIPVIAAFEDILGIKSVLMGFGLDSDAIHSPNEHYGIFNFLKGIETIPYFYQYYTNLKTNE